jgi:hypothetical protein
VKKPIAALLKLYYAPAIKQVYESESAILTTLEISELVRGMREAIEASKNYKAMRRQYSTFLRRTMERFLNDSRAIKSFPNLESAARFNLLLSQTALLSNMFSVDCAVSTKRRKTGVFVVAAVKNRAKKARRAL